MHAAKCSALAYGITIICLGFLTFYAPLLARMWRGPSLIKSFPGCGWPSRLRQLMATCIAQGVLPLSLSFCAPSTNESS